MSYLAHLILEQLEKQPDQTVLQISRNLDVPQKVIMHRFENNLKGKVVQNKDATWAVIENSEIIMQSKADKNINGVTQPIPSPDSDKTNNNFAFDALQSIRNRLLDLTARNRLLNFRHGKTGFIRVIDEMPDQLAQEILDGHEFTYIPIGISINH